MSANWSTLPLDLLGDIAFKMGSLEDFTYFSAVCRSWNRASSSIKSLWTATTVEPWLLLAENTNDNPNCLRNIFNPNNNKRYSLNLPETFGARCWGSPYGWIAMAKRDFSIQLFNPITKATISFPSFQTIPYLSEYKPEDFKDSWCDYYHWVLVVFLQKLIVVKVSQSDGRYEFVIILLYHQARGSKELAFARHGDKSWTTILIKDPTVGIYDVVVKDDLLLILHEYDGAIAYWSVKEFYCLGVVKPMVYSPGKCRIFEREDVCTNNAYLIQSGSDLLMVLRFKESVMNSDDTDTDYDIVYQTIDFKIYKLNPKDKSWENVEDLGNVALFVGDSSSMSVSLAHAKGLQHGCIYFTDDESQMWWWDTKHPVIGGHDMGVFDIKKNHIERFYEGDDTCSSFSAPTWFIPQF